MSNERVEMFVANLFRQYKGGLLIKYRNLSNNTHNVQIYILIHIFIFRANPNCTDETFQEYFTEKPIFDTILAET